MTPNATKPNERANFYETALHYWTTQPSENPELLGVPAVGGGGPIEVLYRQYEELRHFRRIVPIDKSKLLLELGCGNGRWAIALAPLLNYYEGVDFSAQMIAIARSRAEKHGLKNVGFFEAAAQAYGPVHSFDVIYLSGVTQFIEDGDLITLVSELRRYLKPGGVIVERSTVKINGREEVLARTSDQYTSIYRTAQELSSLFYTAGFHKSYQRESYAYFNFPPKVNAFFNRRKIVKMIRGTAPLSFIILRLLALMSRKTLGPLGEMRDYAHVFMRFRRSSDTYV